MRAIYTMDGARGFERSLDAASAEIRARCEGVSRRTALAVHGRAQRGAPKDQGDLIANIAVAGKGLNWRVGILDTRVASRGGNSAHQHPWVYGIWYEYGFLTRSIQAHPFMGPAAEAEQAGHVAAMTAAVQSGLNRAAA